MCIRDSITTGHSQHTRENVPLLVYNKRLFNQKKNIDLGLRETMSDSANTVLEYFNIHENVEQGKSYLDLLK